MERDQRERSPLTLHPAEMQTSSYPAVRAGGHGGLNRSPGCPGMDGGPPLGRSKWGQMRRRVNSDGARPCLLHGCKSFQIVLKVQPTVAKVPKRKLQDHVAAIKTSCARLPVGGRAGRVSIVVTVVVENKTPATVEPVQLLVRLQLIS